MEVAEYVQWTYYESVRNTIWFEPRFYFAITFSRYHLYLESRAIPSCTTFLQILVWSLGYRFFSFISFYFFFCFVFLLTRIFCIFFFFFFFNFCFYSRRFLKCILSFSKMDRYVWTKTIHQTPKICIYRFRFRPASPPLHYCCLSSVQTSFRFHLSVSFRSKPNSKRISTPSLVGVPYIFSCTARKESKSLKFSLLYFYNKLVVHHD